MVVIDKKPIVFLTSISLLAFLFLSELSASGYSEEAGILKKVLENGLTVLVKESPPQNLVAIDVKVKAGSSLEGEYLGSGVSHLVEHMVFKGTMTRGTGDIEREIKSHGGLINAFTSQDLTGFHVTVPSKYLAETLALLKDMLLNAKFDDAELEKEKEVILKEIGLNKDEPQSRISRLLNETAYIRHTYKYPTIGYDDKLKRLTKADVLNYYNKMYAPNRIVIAIVGGIDPPQAISMVEGEFAYFRQPNYSALMDSSPAEPPQIDERRLEEEVEINLSYLAMGFHSTRLLDEDLFAMDVLAMILGRGDNSRLNVSLSKNKRLVPFISSWNYTPSDPGLFIVSAISDTTKLDAAEKAVMDEIEKLRTGLIGDEELETARRMVASDYIFSRQTIDEQASDISTSYILTASCDFSRRYVKGVQGVSRDDVKRVANKYLRGDNLTVIRLVPVGSKKLEAKQAVAPAKDLIKKEVLPNGLRLLVREDKKTPTVSITVALLGGLMVENKTNNGISSLVARMLLKGTDTRREDQIRGAVERRGGQVIPFSGFNSFGLNMELLKEDTELGLTILKDVLTNSVFPQDEIDKEKSLTLAMMKDEDDDIFQRGFNALKGQIFENSSYALRHLGEEASLESLKREDLINFYKTYCAPDNMVISVSGDVDSDSLMKKLTDAFGDLNPELPLSIEFSRASRLDKVKIKSLEMDRQESLVLLGFETVSIDDPDVYILDVLESILSGYSGRLFNTLRDKLSLAYSLGCVQRSALKTGYFAFYVATTKDRIADVTKALVDEIKDIRERLVTDDEIVLAKRELRTKFELGLQVNAFFSSKAALDELYGLGYDNIYKYETQIEKVTKEDIMRVANKYFNLDAYCEVIISSK